MSSEKVQQLFAHHIAHLISFFTENMRRMFYTWLAAARKVRHKRVTLQEREYEMEKIRLENAWDKWRGRFQEEKLLPLVGVYLLLRLHETHNVENWTDN